MVQQNNNNNKNKKRQMPADSDNYPSDEDTMALAFAKPNESADISGAPHVDELGLSETRLGEAFSLLEYKIQQLIARQHQVLMQLHLRLQEIPAQKEGDLFQPADVEAERAAIKAELDAVNAREFEIRSAALTMLKSLEQQVRGIVVSN